MRSTTFAKPSGGCGVIDKFVDERLLLAALDEAADFIIVMDDTPPSRGGPYFVYANQSFLDATGYSRDELIGRPYTAIYSPRNNPQLMNEIARAIEEREHNYREVLARRKNGTEFWVEFVSKQFDGSSARALRLSVGRDITLRRRSLAQVALLFAASEQSSDAVALYEPGPNESLQLTYENDVSQGAGMHRMLELWNDPSERARAICKRLAAGGEISEFFAELDRDGVPRLVQFDAHSVSGPAQLEAIVTTERTLAPAANDEGSSSQSLMLRVAAILPSLSRGRSVHERHAILRAILLDAFGAEIEETPADVPPAIHVLPSENTATFQNAGKSMIVRWKRPLEPAALTALRFCLEAALEQERLPGNRSH